MPVTYDLISSSTISGSSTSSVTFSSIPQTYTDLVVMSSFKKTSGGAANDYLQFNNDTATTYYSFTIMYGAGSSYAGAYRRTSNGTPFSGIVIDDVVTTEYNANHHHILNYTNATTFKTVIGSGGPINSAVQMVAGLWRQTAAITTVKVNISDNNPWVAGSTVSLYGVKAA